jgi:hypothetical protein
MRQAIKAVCDTKDRILLIVGAVSILALVPMLWLWVAYGGAFSSSLVWAGGIGLSVLTAGIGLAMLRILDGDR